MPRRLLTLILAAQLALPTSVWGKAGDYLPTPTPEDTPKFLNKVENLIRNTSYKIAAVGAYDRAQTKKRIQEGVKNAARNRWEKGPGHVSSTLVLLWILGAIEAIHQQEKYRPLTKDPSIRDPKTKIEQFGHWWSQSLATGEHMVNSLELAASFVGGGVLGAPLAAALSLLNPLVIGPTTRPLLARIFAGGTSSFGVFIGWEAGHRVIEQGIWLLDEKDIPIARELKFKELMLGGGTPEQQVVFAKLMAKVFEILTFAQPEVTKLWINNTWRLNIGTGEFITMLSAMVVGGAAAGSIVPGPGWVVGGVGGLAGGIAAMFIPDSENRKVTDAVRRGRTNFGEGRMLVNARELQRVDRALADPNPILGREYLMKEAGQLLKLRMGYRDGIGTALIEQAHDAYLRVQSGQLIIGMADAALVNFADADKTEILKLKTEAEEEIRDGRTRFDFYMKRLVEMQRREADFFGALVFPSDRVSHPLQPMYAKELKAQELVHVSLLQMHGGLSPEKLKDLGLDNQSAEELAKLAKAAGLLFDMFKMQGFTESYLTEE